MDEAKLYHERQSMMRCAKLQNEAFTVADMEAIANDLYSKNPISWINPHRFFIPGVGNYDVNVMLNALQTKGLSTRWFDGRRPVRDIRLDRIVGIICNTRGLSMLRVNISNHWFSVRNISGVYYNLDSKYKAPVPLESENEAYALLDQVLRRENGQLILVIEPGTTDEDILMDSGNSAQVTNQSENDEKQAT